MDNVRARHLGIGQAFLSAFVEERQFGVVDAELVEDRRMQVRDADAVFNRFVAEFVRPHYDDFVEQAALLQIANQGGCRLVDHVRDRLNAALQSTVRVPWLKAWLEWRENLDVADSASHQSPCHQAPHAVASGGRILETVRLCMAGVSLDTSSMLTAMSCMRAASSKFWMRASSSSLRGCSLARY